MKTNRTIAGWLMLLALAIRIYTDYRSSTNGSTGGIDNQTASHGDCEKTCAGKPPE